jgi:hypothetical protein
MAKNFIITCLECGEKWHSDFRFDIPASEAAVNEGYCPVCEGTKLEAKPIEKKNGKSCYTGK